MASPEVREILRKLGLSEQDFDSVRSKTGLEGVVTWHLAKLVPLAEGWLGFPRNRLHQGLIGPTYSDEYRVNARFRASDSLRKWQIVLYRPLMIYLWDVAKIFAMGIGTFKQGKAGPVLTDPSTPKDEPIRQARALLRSFHNRQLRSSSVSAANLDSFQLQVVIQLCLYAEGFVVAHEVGHFVAHAFHELRRGWLTRLLVGDKKRKLIQLAIDYAQDTSKEEVQRFASRLPKDRETADWQPIDYEKAWFEEHVADVIGTLLLNETVNDDPMQSAWCFWGWQACLVMLETLELLPVLKTNVHLQLSTHPAPRLRLYSLRRFWESVIQDANTKEQLFIMWDYFLETEERILQGMTGG